MALRNAFEGLATASKQDGIISLLRALVRSTSYARNANDEMRVVGSVAVTTTSFITNAVQWGNANAYPTWYGTGSGNSVDTREQQMMLSHVAVSNAMQRWTVT